jgi:hypothetical protein
MKGRDLNDLDKDDRAIINRIIKETGCGDVDWIHLSPNRD